MGFSYFGEIQKRKLKNVSLNRISKSVIPTEVQVPKDATTKAHTRPKNFIEFKTKPTIKYEIKSSRFLNDEIKNLKVGRGLFATSQIEKDEIVFTLSTSRPDQKVKVYPLKLFQNSRLKLEKTGWLFDACVTSGRQILVDEAVTKQAFLCQTTTAWYALNHKKLKRGANLKLKHVFEENRTAKKSWIAIQFVALRTIRKGEELFFDYGQTPREWNQKSKKEYFS